MNRLIAVFLIFFLVPTYVYALDFETIIVPEGDVEALVEAIDAANNAGHSQLTIVELSGEYIITNVTELPPIAGWVRLVGPARLRGVGSIYSTLQGDKYGPKQLFHVMPRRELEIISIEFKDFSLNHSEQALFVNEGMLYFYNVQFTNVSTEIACGDDECTPHMPIVINHNRNYDGYPNLRFYGTTFLNSGFIGSGVYSSGGILNNLGYAEFHESQIILNRANWLTPLENNHLLGVFNTSFLYESDDANQPVALIVRDKGSSEIANSVLSGFSDRSCDSVRSLGHNLIDSDTCGWSSNGDVTGWSGKLLSKPVNLNRQGISIQIPTNVLIPEPYDTANYNGDPEWCLLSDVLNHAREGRLIPLPPGEKYVAAKCSRGAVEVDKIGLSDGGINGLYYNPDADGHYIQIQQTDYLTLVIWNTYDELGNQAWVFGTGQLSADGKTVTAETYINRNVAVTPGSSTPEVEAEYWGTMKVEINSCMEGSMTYETSIPEFASGSFPIKRLAFVKQVGCYE